MARGAVDGSLYFYTVSNILWNYTARIMWLHTYLQKEHYLVQIDLYDYICFVLVTIVVVVLVAAVENLIVPQGENACDSTVNNTLGVM